MHTIKIAERVGELAPSGQLMVSFLVLPLLFVVYAVEQAALSPMLLACIVGGYLFYRTQRKKSTKAKSL